MTRFNITLQEGVDFVLKCLKNMWGGELFVPKIPSYRITDIAKAVNSESRIDVVGIRPGEKIHEEMITETDALSTIEFQDYFVILPSAQTRWEVNNFITESNNAPGSVPQEGFSYNSGTNKHFLSVDELRVLIENNITKATSGI